MAKMDWQENMHCIDCIPLRDALKMALQEDEEVKLAYQLRIIAVQLYKLSRAVNPKSITWGPEDLPFFILHTNRIFLDHATGRSPVSLAKLEDLYFATVGKLKDLLTNVDLRLNNDFNAATDTYLTCAHRARARNSHHSSSSPRFTGSISAGDFKGLLNAQKAVLFGEEMMLSLESALKRELARKQTDLASASASMSLTCDEPEDSRRTAAGRAESPKLTTDLLWPHGSPNVRHAITFPPAIIVGTLREKYLLDAIRIAPDADKALDGLDCQQGGGLELERETLAPLIHAAMVLETKKDVCSDGSGPDAESSSAITQADPCHINANEPGLSSSLNPLDQANPRLTSPEKGPKSYDPLPSARIGDRVLDSGRRSSKHCAERTAQKPTAGRTDRSSSTIKLHCCDLNSSCHVGQQFLYGLPIEEIVARLDLLRAQLGNYEQKGKFHVYKSTFGLSWERRLQGGPRYVMRAAFRRIFHLQPTMVR
ncbi:MAG: hypothetical protein Q9183_000269 [Haloplaca sp. 2 TL-2023]